jgi:hypothetical protein
MMAPLANRNDFMLPNEMVASRVRVPDRCVDVAQTIIRQKMAILRAPMVRQAVPPEVDDVGLRCRAASLDK